MNRTSKITIGIAGVAVIATAVAIGAQHPATHPKHPTTTITPQHHQHHKKSSTKPVPSKKSTTTPQTPVMPSAGQNSATSAQASLAALTQKEGVATPSGSIDVVKNLAKPTQQWAFATLAAKGKSTGYTLWFGEQPTANGPWTWIPSTLPGALSKQLPPVVYSALLWAYDLHTGQAGPNLYGTVSWSSVTGHVGKPVAWTATESYGELAITVWVPSYTGVYSGYYGVQSGWYRSTIATGQSGLSMIETGGTNTLAQLAAGK